MAARRNGKVPVDEETIEWDLTDFAIEESIVKRRSVPIQFEQSLRCLKILHRPEEDSSNVQEEIDTELWRSSNSASKRIASGLNEISTVSWLMSGINSASDESEGVVVGRALGRGEPEYVIHEPAFNRSRRTLTPALRKEHQTELRLAEKMWERTWDRS